LKHYEKKIADIPTIFEERKLEHVNKGILLHFHAHSQSTASNLHHRISVGACQTYEMTFL